MVFISVKRKLNYLGEAKLLDPNYKINSFKGIHIRDTNRVNIGLPNNVIVGSIELLLIAFLIKFIGIIWKYNSIEAILLRSKTMVQISPF